MKSKKLLFRASVECELNEGSAQIQDDNKISFATEGCASVARNLPINFLFHEAQLLKSHLWAEGTVK